MNDCVLRLDSVTKRFGTVKAVDGVSFAVPRGTIHGFLGPNGAGKTTTIRMIMDIIRPDSGSIDFDGGDGTSGARGRIGYLPEERGLYGKMTVDNVLTYFGRLKGMSPGDIESAKSHWLGRMDLEDCRGRKVENLSKGMQQKLQFIVTVINDPAMLILDEPFSGLDPINLDIIRDTMLDIRDKGATIIFSTHMMEHADRLCDSIVLINKGRIVVGGPLDDIRQRFSSPAVLIRTAGDNSFIDGMAGVLSTKREGGEVKVTLAESVDPQAFLEAVMKRDRLLSFRLATASLHEIFVHSVQEAAHA